MVRRERPVAGAVAGAAQAAAGAQARPLRRHPARAPGVGPQRDLSHAEFLELVLADEVTRRETTSAALRARAAGLDADICFENWDDTTKVAYDRAVVDG